MSLQCHSVRGLLLRRAALVLALFLLSGPLFYLAVLADSAPDSYLFLYFSHLILRVVRFALVLLLGWMLRTRNHPMIFQQEQTRKRVMLCVLAAAAAALFLLRSHIPDNMYYTIARHLGFFDSPALASFRAFGLVPWEQMASAELFFSVLVCIGTVFAKAPSRRPASAKQ